MWILCGAFPVFLVLFASAAVTEQTDGPSPENQVIRSSSSVNCTGILDYEPCKYDSCPKHMPCYCKDGKPYCRCPNFKGRFGDYWYMGSNCEQEWNFLDLILVAVLPGISLTLIVAIIMHCVYSKRKRDALAKVNKTKHVNRAYADSGINYRNPHIPQQGMEKSHMHSMHPVEQSNYEPVSWIPRINSSFNQPQMHMSESTFSNPLHHAQDERQLSSLHSQPAQFQQGMNPKMDYSQPFPGNNAFQGMRVQGLPRIHHDPSQLGSHNYGRSHY